MVSALFTARALRCSGCAAATGGVYPWLLWNKWNFRLFHLFHPALVVDESWVVCGDA
jgi:hypothetical protein